MASHLKTGLEKVFFSSDEKNITYILAQTHQASYSSDQLYIYLH